MPRVPRLDHPGTIHHVVNRGARSTPTFIDDECRMEFLTQVAQTPDRFGVKVLAYALMPNHFHLLMVAGPNGLGASMKHIQSRYSRWLNLQRTWDGPVWRTRYRSRRVEDASYLTHVLAYIHLNPVVARLVPHVDQTTWTSHAAYTGAVDCPDWLERSPLKAAFGTIESYRSYLHDWRVGQAPGPEDFDPADLWHPASRTLPPATPFRLDCGGQLTEEEAWEVVTEITGVPREILANKRRPRSLRGAWWLALWWLPKATGRRPVDIARSLGIHRSSLSQALNKLEGVKSTDPELAKQHLALISRLAKMGD